MYQCMRLFNDDDVEVDWPDTGSSFRNGKRISYDSTKVTVENSVPGLFLHITIENDDHYSYDAL